MIKFSVEKVKLLHQLMAQATGGSVGVRDEGLLDSASESAFATFGGEELYPSKEEKAAKICFSLELNGIRIEASDADVIRLGLSVADGSMKYEEILEWIKNHRI